MTVRSGEPFAFQPGAGPGELLFAVTIAPADLIQNGAIIIAAMACGDHVMHSQPTSEFQCVDLGRGRNQYQASTSATVILQALERSGLEVLVEEAVGKIGRELTRTPGCDPSTDEHSKAKLLQSLTVEEAASVTKHCSEP